MVLQQNSHCAGISRSFCGDLSFGSRLGGGLRSGDAGRGGDTVRVLFTDSHPGETFLELRPVLKRRVLFS